MNQRLDGCHSKESAYTHVLHRMKRGGSSTLGILVITRTVPLRILMRGVILAGIGSPGRVVIHLLIDRGLGRISWIVGMCYFLIDVGSIRGRLGYVTSEDIGQSYLARCQTHGWLWQPWLDPRRRLERTWSRARVATSAAVVFDGLRRHARGFVDPRNLVGTRESPRWVHIALRCE